MQTGNIDLTVRAENRVTNSLKKYFNFHVSKKTKAILWMLFASFSLCVLSILIAQLPKEIHVFESFFLTMLVGTFVMLISAAYTKGRVGHTLGFKIYCLRTFFSTIGIILWFYLFKIISLNEATSITYLVPLFNAVGAVIFLKEKVVARQVIALICGFIGALLILRPGIGQNGTQLLIALSTTIILSIADLITKVQAKSDAPVTQCFYTCLLTTIFSLPLAIMVWKTPTLYEFLFIAIIGIVQLINLYALYQAYTNANLVVVLPFDFTRLIFTAIFAYFLFGELLNFWSFIGVVIVMVSIIYMAKREVI